MKQAQDCKQKPGRVSGNSEPQKELRRDLGGW